MTVSELTSMYEYKKEMFRLGFEVISYEMQDFEDCNNSFRCVIALGSINLNRDKRVGFYAETECKAVKKAYLHIKDKQDEK